VENKRLIQLGEESSKKELSRIKRAAKYLRRLKGGK